MAASRSSAIVTGGFADPVLGSQAAFRRIMDAFARPGTIADLDGFVEAPTGLPPAAAVLLAGLADVDAPVFLEVAEPQAEGWLAFHTGAALARDPSGAAFVLLRAGSSPSGWRRFSVGTQSYPDRAATLLLPVDDLDGGLSLTLSGPGIETERRIAPRGLPDGFLDARAANAALFPRGHDLVIVAGTRCLALPRTTRIVEG